MVPDIQEMAKDHDLNVTMWVLITADDMQRLFAFYSASDVPTLGKSVDEVGLFQEFQEMLVELLSQEFWIGHGEG